jgi:hypothetical protein
MRTQGMVFGLIMVMLGSGCGSEEAELGVCGGSTLVGRQFWNAANCETGTVTRVTNECAVTICDGNPRQASECAGDKLFEATIYGDTVTLSDGAETFELLRELDCARDFPDDVTGCEQIRCLLQASDDVYVQRFPNRLADEQFISDGIWVARDKPWPGHEECTAQLNADPALIALNDLCPF